MSQNETRLSLALKAAEVGAWDLDLLTQQVWCSDVTDELFGLPHDGAPHSIDAYFACIHPDDLPRVVETIRAAIEDNAEHKVEYRVLRPDGSARWLSSRGQVVRDASGVPVRLIGALLDVTDRKRAEDRLELLAASSALLRDVLDADALPQRVVDLLTPRLADRVVMFLFEPGGRARAVAWRSVSPDEAALLDTLLAGTMPADPSLPVNQVLERQAPLLLREGEVRALLDAPRDPEYGRLITALMWREVLVAPMVVHGRMIGAISCTIGTAGRSYDERDLDLACDMAARAALALDNARLYQEAQHAIRSRDSFITVASHDLRSPLTVLLGQAQFLERRAAEYGLDERARRSVRSIREQSARLDRMIGALLDLSRIQSGRLTLDLTPLDLGALLRRIVAELQPTLTRHVITLVGADEPYPLMGDELRLEQVFQNLLDNAVKYSPGGGTVLVRVSAGDGQAQVDVTDQGIGVPADALPRLFQQFYRAANADTRGARGLGVGLYIVREIVGLHGGSVAVTSEESAGSTFTVRLPLASHS